ncbi:MAG: CBS domain-containing protein [Ilumatobacter sp.]|uniref:CBS domain-containing protein n=1 Tax=Ilumatobacter sp. TaxID=1967498 RepID=UPI00329A0282
MPERPTVDLDPLSTGERERRPVRPFVVEDVVRVPLDETLRAVAVALRARDVSFAVVGEGDDIDGVISERDLVAAIAFGHDLDATTARDIESHSLNWASAAAAVGDVAEEMLETNVRHILVCHDDGTLAGVVSMRDLLAALVI